MRCIFLAAAYSSIVEWIMNIYVSAVHTGENIVNEQWISMYNKTMITSVLFAHTDKHIN